MEELSNIFFYGIILFLLILILLSRKRSSEEKGLKPLFEEQCGGRFGLANFSIPFVRHSLYEDFILVSYAYKKVKIPYNKLEFVKIKRHLFSLGVTYEYLANGVTESLIIWTRFPGEVRGVLGGKGLEIHCK